MGYPSVVSLSPEERDLLARTEEIEIETRSASGTVHRTIIWIVVDGEETYIRSVKGDVARCYREATARPDVAIHVGDRSIPVAAVPAPDETSVSRCSEALGAKYRRDASLRYMLRPKTLPTTLRLEARA